MRKLSIILFALFTFFICSSAQQNAKAIKVLDNARAVYEKAGGITADFTISMLQKNRVTESYTGTIKMKGRKFRFATEQMEMWYDGKSQWLMAAETDEVSLSTPSESDMDAINPSVLFQSYSKGYTCKYVGVISVGGKILETVDLIPGKTKPDITKITLQVEQKNSVPVMILIQNKNGINQRINIRNYKTGISLLDNVFAFNPKQFPKAEIVDLR